ncbi:cold-shock protein [Rhizobium puerariae]|uniref:Cold-shock protein n=1 Tax=Rhizobium puerariae TaxID=1585791 RepID=A0ABV6API2_9HYPH
MCPHVYAVGDVVVLKAGLSRTATGDRTCRIVGNLPASDGGEPQYRVRFGNENFERRVVASDIDTSGTSASAGKDEASPKGSDEPWLKPAKIRVGK